MRLSIAALAAMILGGHPVVVFSLAVGSLSVPAGITSAALYVATARVRRRARRARPTNEAEFCSAIAAELHAGASLRQSLSEVAAAESRSDMRRLSRATISGSSPGDVARLLAAALPATGRHAAIAFRLAAETGASATRIFDRLAAQAIRRADLAREQRSLTAQARLSALVVGGAPLAVVALMLATGRLGLLDQGAAGAAVAATGLSLIAGGLVVVWLMVRGAP